jgi:hypothetical protein
MKKLLVVIVLLSLLLPGCIKLGSGDTSDKAPKIHVFTAVPDAVDQGKPVMLSWEVSDASSITIEPGIGIVEPIGTKLVTVTAPTVYTLTATNRFGKTEQPASVAVGISGGTAVDKPPALPGAQPPANQPAAPSFGSFLPTVLFNANPLSVAAGGSAELTWSVKDATSISIDQGIGTVSASDKRTVKPTLTTVYTLTAKNNFGETRKPVIVTVSAGGSMGGLQGPSAPNLSNELPPGQN